MRPARGLLRVHWCLPSDSGWFAVPSEPASGPERNLLVFRNLTHGTCFAASPNPLKNNNFLLCMGSFPQMEVIQRRRRRRSLIPNLRCMGSFRRISQSRSRCPVAWARFAEFRASAAAAPVHGVECPKTAKHRTAPSVIWHPASGSRFMGSFRRTAHIRRRGPPVRGLVSQK